MADTKITGLAALSTGTAIGDLLNVVDISDTSMAATGTNKKLTFTSLFTLPTRLVDLYSVTTDSTAGALTYTAAMFLGGLLIRDPNGAGRSDVTPAASLLVAAISGAAVGNAVFFSIRNNADAAETITVTAGTNCTLSGSGQSTTTVTIAQNNTKLFAAVLTNVGGGTEAYTLYSLGTAIH